MSWRVARSLLVLRDQINALHPDRSKSDDGTIGDERHQGTSSDHNPDASGVVRAMDITHDPAHGVDTYAIAETLLQHRDFRISYVISNGRIWSATVGAYTWRTYHGSNRHDRHVHVSVVADRRADDTAPWDLDQTAPPAPAPAPQHVGSRFSDCLKPLLAHEGGNDDDPDDRGGRTSRGITQNEWNDWRKHHASLPSDVWKAPQDQVAAIYRQEYWDVLNCDLLPPGVDYCVFDFGVNSGVVHSAQTLQRLVGVAVDGHIGPITEKATAEIEARQIINRFCDERMAYLKTRSGWWKYQHGWTTRVANVRRDALAAVAP